MSLEYCTSQNVEPSCISPKKGRMTKPWCTHCVFYSPNVFCFIVFLINVASFFSDHELKGSSNSACNLQQRKKKEKTITHTAGTSFGIVTDWPLGTIQSQAGSVDRKKTKKKPALPCVFLEPLLQSHVLVTALVTVVSLIRTPARPCSPRMARH